MIDEGIHRAQVIDYGLTETQTGRLRVVVLFESTNGERVRWSCSYESEAAKGYCHKMLNVMGAKRTELDENFAEGVESGWLNCNDYYDVNVIHDESGGRTYANVQAIYKDGEGNNASGSMKGQLDKSTASKFFSKGSKKGADKKRALDSEDLPF